MLMPTAEFPQFLNVNGSARFTVYHDGVQPQRGAFLFCHPLFEEKLWAHRAYVNFARRLAGAGFSVLRMDLQGTGDSDGEFGTASISDYLDDLEAGWEELGRRSPAGGIRALFGLRLGGTLALALCERNIAANTIVLWEPVLDVTRYVQELLRSNLTGQMATHGKVTHTREQLIDLLRQGQSIDVEGYQLTPRLYESLMNLILDCREAWRDRNALVLQVSRTREQPLRTEFLALRDGNPTLQVEATIEEPFWREIKSFYGSANNLELKSLSWLRQFE